MKILIKVTKDVQARAMFCGINRTKNKVGTSCEVAVAVLDILPNCWISNNQIMVFTRPVTLDSIDGGHLYQSDTEVARIDLPREAVERIKKFDSLDSSPEERLLLPEFSFEIHLPQEVINSIGISEVYRILSESKTLELVMS